MSALSSISEELSTMPGAARICAVYVTPECFEELKEECRVDRRTEYLILNSIFVTSTGHHAVIVSHEVH